MAVKKEVAAGRIPPQSLDAEKSLLGAVLIDEEILADATEMVHANDFYDKRHHIIFAAMHRLYERHRPVDLLTLTEELKKKSELETVGGSAYLTELTNYVPTAAHAEMMAKGTYGHIILATPDLDGAFDRVQATGAEVVHEPTEQPYGVRDCAFRDPAGNLVRLNEVR